MKKNILQQRHYDLIERTILIVDDDPGILEILRIMLEKKGYRVMIDDGKAVQNKINQKLPDIILLDILMDGIDGRDISRRLKNNSATKKIPIIIVSANANIEERMKEAGADDFLRKPFDEYDLEKMVQKHLN